MIPNSQLKSFYCFFNVVICVGYSAEIKRKDFHLGLLKKYEVESQILYNKQITRSDSDQDNSSKQLAIQKSERCERPRAICFSDKVI